MSRAEAQALPASELLLLLASQGSQRPREPAPRCAGPVCAFTSSPAGMYHRVGLALSFWPFIPLRSHTLSFT